MMLIMLMMRMTDVSARISFTNLCLFLKNESAWSRLAAELVSILAQTGRRSRSGNSPRFFGAELDTITHSRMSRGEVVPTIRSFSRPVKNSHGVTSQSNCFLSLPAKQFGISMFL